MKIVLATGIYPPDIGGPATYVRELARELSAMKHKVIVLTYKPIFTIEDDAKDFAVVRVTYRGGPFCRWKAFSRALRKYAHDADAVVAFSSVSVGIPLILSRLNTPKRYLRLGGDFFWERYTDMGGKKGLGKWYHSNPLGITRLLNTAFMPAILGSFSTVVYSTDFQRKLHESAYGELPKTSVIQNAVPSGTPTSHTLHSPMKLLCLSRLVGFKNIEVVIRGLPRISNATLTITGDGPLYLRLKSIVSELKLDDRINFIRPVSGANKQEMLQGHDLLIIPSITEVSPNAALEARASGLPVLLTSETGLSEELTTGMVIRSLGTPEEVWKGVEEVRSGYEKVSKDASATPPNRSWKNVAEDWVKLLSARK